MKIYLNFRKVFACNHPRHGWLPLFMRDWLWPTQIFARILINADVFFRLSTSASLVLKDQQRSTRAFP